jgi:uncharacterized protein (TIGR00730 family)
MRKLRCICVFCGSVFGARPGYVEAAHRFGSELATRRIGLVYGGASIGLMGALADAVLDGGGTVDGVIPRALVEREVGHPGLTRLHVVETMHERKALMSELSDAFVALPGGMGTIDELAEAFTWAQLGIHDKPCGLLDAEGYFDALLEFLDRAVEDGFLPTAHRALLLVDTDPGSLLEALAAAEPLPHKFATPTP